MDLLRWRVILVLFWDNIKQYLLINNVGKFTIKTGKWNCYIILRRTDYEKFYDTEFVIYFCPIAIDSWAIIETEDFRAVLYVFLSYFLTNSGLQYITSRLSTWLLNFKLADECKFKPASFIFLRNCN